MYSQRPIFRFILAFFLVFLLDQASKAWAMEQGSVTLNTGVSFSLLSQAPVFLHISLTILALGVIGWGLREIWVNMPLIAGGIAGAALSNLIDRVIYGGVRDFLPVPILNVHNNMADWVIFWGMGWVVWTMVQRKV